MTVGSGRVLLQFILLAATWGASFLFIKIGLEGLSPAQVVLGRLVTGAVALIVACAVTRQPLPRSPALWLHLLVVALLLCVLPFLLFAWAEQRIASGLASIYNATTPLMTMLVALAALPGERPTRSRLAGLVVGFIGVVFVLGPWHGSAADTSVLAQLACLAATACYGIAFVYLRRFVSPRRIPAIQVAAIQVGLAGAVMLLLSPLIATSPVRISPVVLLAVSALGIFGTGLAYVWNTNVVAGLGATNAATVTYLTPIVGVALGVALRGEHLDWNEPVGAAVVVLGIALSQGRLNSLLDRLHLLTGREEKPKGA